MKIAKNWNQVTIGQFQELQLLTEPTFENQIKTVAILTGKSTDAIEELAIVELTAIVKDLGWMATLPNPKDMQTFRIGGTWYYFVVNHNQLAAHQFITVQDLFADNSKWIGNLHKIMASLCVRKSMLGISKPVKSEEFDNLAELFRNRMPISVAYAYTLFFSLCLPGLLETTRQYLEQEVENLRKMAGEKSGQQ